MKKLFCFVLIIVCFKLAQAQQLYNVTGVVNDEKDQPIPGATVFLGDSRNATAADRNGRFVLSKVQPGKYTLVVRMIGYQLTTYEFVLQNKDAKFSVKLPQDNKVLNTVNITALKRHEKEYYFELFVKSFFGPSSMARDCRILNPEVINYSFNRDKQILTASTDDLLIIENRALGYKIKYLLTNFSYDILNSGLTAFAGRLFYEDMPGSVKQQQAWKEARADVYFGSISHFFRALFNDKASENKFVIYRVPNQQLLAAFVKQKKDLPARYAKPVKSLSSLIADSDNNFKKIDLKPLITDSTELLILYTPKREPKEFMSRGLAWLFKMPLGQLSFLRPMGDSVLLSRNGDVSPAANLLKGGFWSWGQMAGFIPSDYELPPDLETPLFRRLKKKEELMLAEQAE